MVSITEAVRQVADAQVAAVTARATAEEAIRAAIAAGVPARDICDALGTTNRGWVYALMGRGGDGQKPSAPTLTPVVYLRGAGRPQATWDRVEPAMWARGWGTTHGRTDAWHLARGGVPVVLCDFSTHLDDVEPAPGGGVYYGYHRYVVVGRVRARCAEQEMDLPLANGGRSDGQPLRRDSDGREILDEIALARMVAEALGVRESA